MKLHIAVLLDCEVKPRAVTREVSQNISSVSDTFAAWKMMKRKKWWRGDEKLRDNTWIQVQKRHAQWLFASYTQTFGSVAGLCGNCAATLWLLLHWRPSVVPLGRSFTLRHRDSQKKKKKYKQKLTYSLWISHLNTFSKTNTKNMNTGHVLAPNDIGVVPLMRFSLFGHGLEWWVCSLKMAVTSLPMDLIGTDISVVVSVRKCPGN